jgi:hypothetical protein
VVQARLIVPLDKRADIGLAILASSRESGDTTAADLLSHNRKAN